MSTVSPQDDEFLESKSGIYRGLVRVEQALAILLLVTLFLLIIIQVTARHGFSAPISGTEELARFTFIWFTFIAASFVAARRKHIIVQLYGGGGTGRLIAAIEVFAYTIVIAVSIAMVIGGFLMVQSTWNISSPGTGLPYRFVYSALPIGFALIALHASLNLVLALRHPEQFVGKKDIETAGL
ncbi:TRAP transporter small permease [Nesterenkonia natronophila]|uniref:TRAP transporter small permease n=1 Tax=Nesterenkonia natronophila TaxID=2174932 RepID=A0A3A4F3F9_9MICC|nr:TRAP transporter small permease [Nesterenkonia natronophila]RJN32376.1 TRAP transporter small permease [Nesterenkonia natronophila]